MEGFWRDGEYVLVSTLEAELAGQRRQAEKLRRDAERYRWLCENRDVLLLTGFFGNGCINRTIGEVHAAIDDAMLKTPNDQAQGEAQGSSRLSPGATGSAAVGNGERG